MRLQRVGSTDRPRRIRAGSEGGAVGVGLHRGAVQLQYASVEVLIEIGAGKGGIADQVHVARIASGTPD